MSAFRYLVLACLVALSQHARAQEFPTIFPALGNENPNEIDALTGRCSSDDNGDTLSCIFITVVVNYETDNEGTTCKLWGTAGNETLSRVAPGRWSTRTEPSGLCGVVNTVELSCNPQALMECSFFERSVYTVTTGEFCEHYETIEDQGDRYSWQVTDKRELGCDHIEFGYQ